MLIEGYDGHEYELNYYCLSQSITKPGLQEVVRRTIANVNIGVHAA